MKKRALFLTWDGFQDQEVIYPYHRLLADDFIVDIVGSGSEYVTGLFGTKFKSVGLANSVISSNYDLLILPGGVKALEKIRQDEAALDIIKNWKGVIGSICHGAQLLISAKRVDGQIISGYYSIKDDILNAGAAYSRVLVRSGNIVSAAHYNDMGKWMELVLTTYYANKI